MSYNRATGTLRGPCVVALEITGGNPAFLQWVTAQCGGEG